VRIDPKYLEACVELAAGLHNINPVRYGASILALTGSVLGSDPKNVKARKLAAAAHFARAQSAIESADWEPAAESLRESFLLDPLDVTIEAFEYCAERSGKLRDVMTSCEERVRHEPADLRSTFVLGRICVRLAMTNAPDREELLFRAETSLNRVLEFSPNHAEAWYWLGASFILGGSDANARDIVEVLRSLDPGRGRDLEVLSRESSRSKSTST
jgi:Flp pilus assembly protein TadD